MWLDAPINTSSICAGKGPHNWFLHTFKFGWNLSPVVLCFFTFSNCFLRANWNSQTPQIWLTARRYWLHNLLSTFKHFLSVPAKPKGQHLQCYRARMSREKGCMKGRELGCVISKIWHYFSLPYHWCTSGLVWCTHHSAHVSAWV